MLKRLNIKIRRTLSLGHDKSEQETIAGIEDAVEFRGAKLWVLVLAIFVASLGLNTNSTAVIIGAMLISPLMGPIIGMGLGVGINDFTLLKRAFHSYLIATLFSIVTATFYFLLTPMIQAQSELLARTSPTIYDVLIALFGGLAGIIALSSYSQRTGNVIPGVAIATALMPPLCTVGYGLATANWLYAAGAFYLYLINSIFIAVATFLGVKFIMRFHKKHFVDKKREQRVSRLITAVSIITVIPSIFITVNILQSTLFQQRCLQFVKNAVTSSKNQIIAHECDYSRRTLRVVMLGEKLDSIQVQELAGRLEEYHLHGVTLDIVQEQSGVNEETIRRMLGPEKQQTVNYEQTISVLKDRLDATQQQLAPYHRVERHAVDLLPEMQILYPQITALTMGLGVQTYRDSVQVEKPTVIVKLTTSKRLLPADVEKVLSWIKKRMNSENVILVQ